MFYVHGDETEKIVKRNGRRLDKKKNCLSFPLSVSLQGKREEIRVKGER